MSPRPFQRSTEYWRAVEELRPLVPEHILARGVEIELASPARGLRFTSVEDYPEFDEVELWGTVQGTDLYDVSLTASASGDVVVSCSCPAFEQAWRKSPGPCKHTVAFALRAIATERWQPNDEIRSFAADFDGEDMWTNLPRLPAERLREEPVVYAQGDAWRDSLASVTPGNPLPLLYTLQRDRYRSTILTIYRREPAARGPGDPTKTRLIRVFDGSAPAARWSRLPRLDAIDARIVESVKANLTRFPFLGSGVFSGDWGGTRLAKEVLVPAAAAGRLHAMAGSNEPGPALPLVRAATWRGEARLAADPRGLALVHARLIGAPEGHVDSDAIVLDILEGNGQCIGSAVLLGDRLIDLDPPAPPGHSASSPRRDFGFVSPIPAELRRLIEDGPRRWPATEEASLLRELCDAHWAERRAPDLKSRQVPLQHVIEPDFAARFGISYFTVEPKPILRLEGSPRRETADLLPLVRYLHPDDPAIVRERDVRTICLLPGESEIHQGYVPTVDRRRLEALHQRATAMLRRARGTGQRQWRVPRTGLPKLLAAAAKEGFAVEWGRQQARMGRNWSVSVKSGIDWFDLFGGLNTDEGVIPLHQLVSATRRHPDAIELLPLGDGSSVMVPAQLQVVLRRLSKIWHGDSDTGALRFASGEAMLLDALLEGAQRRSHDRAFLRARDRLLQRKVRPTDPGPSFRGNLRPYQREGLGWLRSLPEVGLGGCLADEMGLGKTVQVLALLDLVREESTPARRIALAKRGGARRPSLLVVPRSLVRNWLDEAARFTPSLRLLDLSQPDRRMEDATARTCDVAVVTYGTLLKDVETLAKRAFEWVVLDEAQAIKNERSRAAKAVKCLDARHRLAITGTPIENHLGEFWSVMEFLNRPLAERLARLAGGAEPDQLAVVRRAVQPFLLRRTKLEVAPDLPARIEQTIFCDLADDQREHYEALHRRIRADLLAEVKRIGLDRSKLRVLEGLLRLRQAACHPALADRRRRDAGSGKLDALLPMLEESIEAGRKTLVFSQFTSFLAILRERLEQRGIVYEYLDGATRDRAQRVERFSKDESIGVFLLSLKAGGVGLNLHAAERVILLDPWWNPAVEAQAIDRTHRIGQTRTVHALRLVSAGTIEERVLELQRSKRHLAEAILGDGSGGRDGAAAERGPLAALTSDDLKALLR